MALAIFPVVFVAPSAWAQYNYFNIASGSDCTRQDYRSANVPPGVYDAIHQDYVSSSDGGSGYFYGGFTHQNIVNGATNTLVQYVCWPAGGSYPYSYLQQIPYFAGTNMTWSPQIAEGSSCCIKGYWPQFTTNLWTREAVRYWQPANGTPHLGYQGMWIKEPVSGNWYHVATFQYPFAITGVQGLGGWQENIGGGYSGNYIVDHTDGYFHTNGVWAMANQIQYTAHGDVYLIATNTATESACGPAYTNAYNVTSSNPVTLVVSNQPAIPTFDPILVSNATATLVNTQLLVQWQVPPASSPQFSYQVQVYTNADLAGNVVASAYNNDPEARQVLLNLPAGITTPYAALTVADIFFNTNPPIAITPATPTPSPATGTTGTVGGLTYQYYQNNTTTWGSLPNFSSQTPVLSGAVSFPDLSPRRQRTNYGFNFTGFITAPATGLYAFTLHSGDGSLLAIDGTNVIDFDGVHDCTQFKSGGIALAAGAHTFNLQFFQGAANTRMPTAYTDGLGLSWSGPGISQGDVPASAFSRTPGVNEPAITMTGAANGAVMANINTGLGASVTTNGATINGVQFYLTEYSSYYFRPAAGADYCVDSISNAAWQLNPMIWAAPTNLIRARLIYNGTNTIDSAPVSIITTNTSSGSWNWNPIEMHDYPAGANVQNGVFTLLGDGMDLMSQPVSGNCTLVARLRAMTPNVPSPDGIYPESTWRAGIILRGTTNATIGQPLGDGTDTRFAAMFSSVGGGAYYENDTMRDGNGDANAWSSDLGNYNWFKLVRSNLTNFTSYVSPDGINWTQENVITLTNDIAPTVYAGVFVYADQSLYPNINWAAFDNVSITGDILGPPAVYVTPGAVTNYTGQAATLTAVTTGNPPFNYQWQFNGGNLAGATNATLTLTNLQPPASGWYTAVVSDTNGTASGSAALTVLTLPTGLGIWPAALLSNTPYAYWPLSEASGTTAYDGNGPWNGAYSNCVLGVAGPQPPAFPGFPLTNCTAQFNGVSSGVGLGTGPSLNGSTDFSVLGWIKTTANSSGVVIQQRDSTGSGYVGEYQLSMNSSGTVSFWIYHSGYQFQLTSSQVVNDGNWHCLAAVRQGTNGYIYVDGQLGASGSGAEQALSSGIGTYIGYDQRGSGNYFNGQIGAVALFTNALSATAIQSLESTATSTPPMLVSLSAPANGAQFGAPAAINLSASVSTNGHSISSVQFYNSATLLGQTTTPPYTCAWTNVPAGQYTLYAQVTYDAGSNMVSTPAFVTVNPLPSTPTGVTALALASNLVSITWLPATNAAGYELVRNGTVITTLAATNWLDIGLAANTVYGYSVTATNAYGISPASATNSVTTPGSIRALYWDANAVAGPQDGNGNWGSSATTWWNGFNNLNWTNGSLAVFGTGSGTNSYVVLTNTVTPSGLLFAPDNGGSFLLSSSASTAVLMLTNTPTFTLNSSVNISSPLGGGGFSLTGPGTLTLPGENTNTGSIIVNGAYLLATGGGWYENRSIGSGSLIVSNGGTAEFTQSHGFGESNYGEPVTLNNGTLQLDGDNYASAITLTAGTINGAATHYLAPISGMTCTVNASAITSIINTPTLALQGNVTFTVARGSGPADLQLTGGVITGSSAAMTKSGAGVLQISSSAGNSGVTTISAGTMQVDGALGTNTVTVQNSATLSGAGTVNGGTTVQAGGMIAPGDATAAGPAIGSLDMANNLTFNSGAKSLFKLSKNGGTLTNDLLVVDGTLNLGGTLTVTNIGTNALALGDTIRLFTANATSGAFSSEILPALTTNLTWNTASLVSAGTISVVQLPIITAQPQSLWVNPGDTASFSVTATGSGTLSYQWQLGGTNLSGDTAATLAINNVQAANAGNYTVAVSSSYGAITSAPAILTLNQPPLINSAGLAASGFGVNVSGNAGQTYILLTTSNLADPIWVPVATNIAVTNGTFQITDPSPTNAPERFYRVGSP